MTDLDINIEKLLAAEGGLRSRMSTQLVINGRL